MLILLAAAGVSLVLAFLEADQEDGVSAFVEPVVRARASTQRDQTREKTTKIAKKIGGLS